MRAESEARSAPERVPHWIGGRETPGEARRLGDVFNPATGGRTGQVSLGTAADVEAAQSRAVHEVKACLGEAWAEIKDRSSAGYVVLHPATGNASITLSIDEKDNKQDVVRHIVFLR